MTRKQSFLQFILSLIFYIIILPLFAGFLSPTVFQLLPIRPESNGLGELFFANILAYLLSGLVIQFIFIVFNQKSIVDSILSLQFEKNIVYIIKLISKVLFELVTVATSVFQIIFTIDIIRSDDSFAKTLLFISYIILLSDILIRSFTKKHYGLIDSILQIKQKNNPTKLS